MNADDAIVGKVISTVARKIDMQLSAPKRDFRLVPLAFLGGLAW